MEQRDQLLDLIIKAQRSSMRSGAEKRSWVISQMEGAGPELANGTKGSGCAQTVCEDGTELRGSTLPR